MGEESPPRDPASERLEQGREPVPALRPEKGLDTDPDSQNPSDTASLRAVKVLLSPRVARLTRWTMVVLVLGGAGFAAVKFATGSGFTEADISSFVSQFGPGAPVVFMLVFAVVGCLLVPTTLLTVAGAALFGSFLGFIYSVVGAFLSALLGFSAARTVGRDVVQKWLAQSHGRLARFDARLAEKGFMTALFMRLLYIPNGLINLVCGVSGIPLRTYAVATLLGLIPMAFAVTYMTDGVLDAVLGGDWNALVSTETILAATLFFGCLSVPLVSAWLGRRRAQ